jgi:hypothetical protein
MFDRADLRNDQNAAAEAAGLNAFRDELFAPQGGLEAVNYSRHSVHGGPSGFSADRERMSGSYGYAPSYQRDSIYLPPSHFGPVYGDNPGGYYGGGNYGYDDRYYGSGGYNNDYYGWSADPYDSYGGGYNNDYYGWSADPYDSYGGGYYDDRYGGGNVYGYYNNGDVYDFYRNDFVNNGRYTVDGNGYNNSYFYGNSYDPYWDGAVTHHGDGFVVDRSWSGRGYRFYGRQDYQTGLGAYLTMDSRRDSVQGGPNGYSADRQGWNGGYSQRGGYDQGWNGGYNQRGGYNDYYYGRPSPGYAYGGGSYDRDNVRGGRDGYYANRERYRGGGWGGGGYSGGGPEQVFDFALRGFDSFAGYDIARRYARRGR